MSRAIVGKPALVSVSKTSNTTCPSDSCYFEVFKKLTRAMLLQIALEIITYTKTIWREYYIYIYIYIYTTGYQDQENKSVEGAELH